MIKHVTITEAQAEKINEMLASGAIESDDAPQAFVNEAGGEWICNILCAKHIYGDPYEKPDPTLMVEWFQEVENNIENGGGAYFEIPRYVHVFQRDEQFYLLENCWEWKVSTELFNAAKNLAAV